MTTIQIKHRFTDAVLFECEAPEGMSSGLQMRHAVERAVLAGAYLAGAYLAGAYLAGANLARANLDGANLARANLDGANLDGANLARANLDGANLDGGVTLVGDRPIFQVGPIGSRCAFFTSYITSDGLRFDAGCQRQITREKFEERLIENHGDNEHAKEYRAALALIDIHAEIWTPK